jgi:hypothetical protein
MKRVTQEVITKEAGIDLEMEVSMDGETIIKGRADSLIGNFLRLFYGMLGRTGDSDTRRMISRERSEFRDIANSGENNYAIDWINFNKADTADPPRMRVDNDIHWFDQDNQNNPAYIYTNIPKMCGFYYPAPQDYEFDLYHIDEYDPRTGSMTKGPPADWSGVDRTQWNGKLWFREMKFVTGWRRRDTFQDPNIILGKNIDNGYATDGLDQFAAQGAVGIDDQWLRMQIRSLSTTGTTISEPAVGTNDSEITLSRTFTNNNTYPIDVGEIGVICKNGVNDRGSYSLIARDIVTPFTISADSSVTIDYTITLSNNGGGGMMSQFHQLLYRQFKTTGRNVRDINNNDQNGEDHSFEGQFIGASVGGDQDQTERGNNNLGAFVGPVPGVTTNALANTNVSLGGDPSNADGQVPHGEGDDQLYYSGAMVEDFHMDEANGEVWFETSRLMENRGSTAITIKETGYYSGNHKYNNQDYPRYSVMISRHILGTSVDIAPGEVFKLTYVFKVKL